MKRCRCKQRERAFLFYILSLPVLCMCFFSARPCACGLQEAVR